MASIERTAYPRFKRYFTPSELTQVYTPTSTEIAFGLATTTGQVHFLSLMVLLKAFQRLGYFPKLSDIPKSIVNHIRSCLELSAEINPGYEQSRTLYRHKSAIREYLNVTLFDSAGRHLAVKAVYESAQVMDNPADLINVAIAELINHRYELPGFNTLNRLVKRVRYLVNQKLFLSVVSQLDEEYILRLDALLESHPVHRRSPYNDLKQLPKSPSRNHLNDLLVHLNWLVSLGEVKPYLKDITEAKLQHWTAEAKALDAGSLKEMLLPKRLTLLLCLIYSAQVKTRDNLVEMFLKRLRTIHNKAKDKLEEWRLKYQATTEKLVNVLSNVLMVFADDPPEVEVIKQLNQVLDTQGGVSQLLTECEAVNAYSGNNYLPLIWQFYKSHRSAFFRLLGALKFASTSQDQSLIEALQFLWSNAHRRGEWLPATVDLSFASNQWQKLVMVQRGEQTLLVRRHFEVCVFSYLANELKSGDICVEGSSAYADYP